MSLWKVMTRPMSQAAQVAGAQEAAQVNTTVRGREREHKLQLLSPCLVHYLTLRNIRS